MMFKDQMAEWFDTTNDAGDQTAPAGESEHKMRMMWHYLGWLINQMFHKINEEINKYRQQIQKKNLNDPTSHLEELKTMIVVLGSRTSHSEIHIHWNTAATLFQWSSGHGWVQVIILQALK